MSFLSITSCENTLATPSPVLDILCNSLLSFLRYSYDMSSVSSPSTVALVMILKS
jgi:hypothetical protein